MEPIKVSENNRNFKLVIVGAGGTGSHLISFITQVFSNNKNVDIVVIDADVVEWLDHDKFSLIDLDQPNKYGIQGGTTV